MENDKIDDTAREEFAEIFSHFESLLDEKDEVNRRIREFLHEQKNAGHDVGAMKTVAAIKRRGNSEEVDAKESMIEFYREILGV